VKHAPWQVRWFATEEKAREFVRKIYASSWGVELIKVNRGNKRYSGGWTVRWYAR
jgi:hypothetical protein